MLVVAEITSPALALNALRDPANPPIAARLAPRLDSGARRGFTGQEIHPKIALFASGRRARCRGTFQQIGETMEKDMTRISYFMWIIVIRAVAAFAVPAYGQYANIYVPQDTSLCNVSAGFDANFGDGGVQNTAFVFFGA